MLVGSASALAAGMGLSEWAIGITIVAGGTSLPELATSIAAARRGRTGLIAGTLIGSDLFNLLGVLGLAAFLHPLEVDPIATPGVAMMTMMVAFVLLFMRHGLAPDPPRGAHAGRTRARALEPRPGSTGLGARAGRVVLSRDEIAAPLASTDRDGPGCAVCQPLWCSSIRRGLGRDLHASDAHDHRAADFHLDRERGGLDRGRPEPGSPRREDDRLLRDDEPGGHPGGPHPLQSHPTWRRSRRSGMWSRSGRRTSRRPARSPRSSFE